MSSARPREMLIHDNGGRPFKVNVCPGHLDVYIGKWANGDYDYSNHWRRIEYEDIFIGQGVYDSVEYCEFSYGNAVLVRLKGDSLKYLYIGSHIVEFEVSTLIDKFVSTVGNSDVPYSFARDVDGGHYFFQGNSPVDFVKSSIPAGISNGKPSAVYEYYYNRCCSAGFPDRTSLDAVIVCEQQ